jgi:undecaprenyl diphosphate synthase
VSIFSSPTQEIPEAPAIPRHVAIIMDGNGRWAKQRYLPRVAGHRKGADAVRETIRRSVQRGVEYLTLFAFSSENWRRPPEEVSVLMQLFLSALEQEISRLHENNIRFKVIGDLSRFDGKIVELIRNAEALTQDNTRLTLTVAANYGGRWDMMQAVQRMSRDRPELATKFDEADLTPYLSMHHAPEPDLFIRTGGEQRISNFLLWQLAYTELYFTNTLWPDFNGKSLDSAIESYQSRERRFGRTSDQLRAAKIGKASNV